MSVTVTKAPGNDRSTAADIALPGWNIDQLDYSTMRITLIAKIITRLTIRELSEQEGMSYAEWRVLVRLATARDGFTVGQIADLAWADRAEVSRAATLLEEKGLTSRRDNPEDRRSPILFLLPKGKRVYAAGIKKRGVFHEGLMDGLTDDERADLDRLLLKIGRNLMKQFRAADDAIAR